MLPKRIGIIYSPRYRADIGSHVFPTEKYRIIKEKLLEHRLIEEQDLLESQMASDEELLTVHTPEYLDDLRNLRETYRTIYSELPLTKEIVDAYILCAGGSILASRCAVENKGCGLHIGGGFHHTFADHAEGFCYINDIAVAIRVMQKEGRIKKAFVVDCDLHQGNGTAHIFQDDPDVFTFSIHQENNYPVKQKSDLDIGLADFAGNDIYLNELKRAIPDKLDSFAPDMVLYVAGADPFENDQLGLLKLTFDGLQKRDQLVIDYCYQRQIPLAIVLAGGYAYRTEDTVQIHFNTMQAAISTFSQAGS